MEIYKVIINVLDGFKDQLERKNLLHFKFTLSTWGDVGNDDVYKAKDDGSGSKFNTNISCIYSIGGEEGLTSLRVTIDSDSLPEFVNMLPPQQSDPDENLQILLQGPISNMMFGDHSGMYLGTGIFSTYFVVVTEDRDIDKLVSLHDNMVHNDKYLAGRLTINLVGMCILLQEEKYTMVTIGRKRGIWRL
eukprot:6982401-Ditylum_brightwellii.AAC.1